MANSFLAGAAGDGQIIRHRSALANNGAIYDGINDYDFSSTFVNSLSANQPFTVLQAFFLPNLPPPIGLGLYYLLNTRHQDSPIFGTPGWIWGSITTTGQMQYYGVSRTNPVTGLQGFTTTGAVRIGYNITIFTFAGGVNNTAGMEAHINGRRSGKTSVFGTVVASDPINAFPGIATGAFNVTSPGGPGLFFNGRMRKAQIINRVATPGEIREAFNLGTLEGVVSDANFILDLDFNRTSGPLITRPGTPSATFTAFGGRTYGPF